eukprot:365697-Chlamydomonas_euryale.AAC.9
MTELLAAAAKLQAVWHIQVLVAAVYRLCTQADHSTDDGHRGPVQVPFSACHASSHTCTSSLCFALLHLFAPMFCSTSVPHPATLQPHHVEHIQFGESTVVATAHRSTASPFSVRGRLRTASATSVKCASIVSRVSRQCRLPPRL